MWVTMAARAAGSCPMKNATDCRKPRSKATESTTAVDIR